MNDSSTLISLTPCGHHARGPVIALLGNPNAGKTTLFNVLTGLRAKTANFPGTTVEQRRGRFALKGHPVHLVDLPGVYSLSGVTLEEKLVVQTLKGDDGFRKPDGLLVVVDATNLERNLFLASQAAEMGIPLVVALNMSDLARREGFTFDVAGLARELNSPVVEVAALTGEGLTELKAALGRFVGGGEEAGVELVAPLAVCEGCSGCPYAARHSWAEGAAARCTKNTPLERSPWTDRLDAVMTHRVFGVGIFFAVMLGVFYLIFQAAAIPMDLIDLLFAQVGGWLSERLPDGHLKSLVVDGVVGGVGGVLIFLPQICILFFALSLLDDTGYLARAAFVMDRLMRRIGLPGKAFVPLLSAHACAIPAVMAARIIEDKRDRLVTILVAPLLTCSARIPVYAMVSALLFPDDAFKASLCFTSGYALGIVMALVMAFLFKRTVLPGESRPLVLELPNYRWPSLRTAILYTYDRAAIFVKKAGTVILLISMGLWVLATFPESPESAEVEGLRAQAVTLAASGDADSAAAKEAEAEQLASTEALAGSFAGRMGHWVEPVLKPLGFDWKIGIGILTSFAAREVIVSTLAIVYGVGADAADEDPESLYDTLRASRRSDGSPVFNVATCFSLFVFYVLAAQCLATQAVVRRETNSWKWPLFQLVYMTVLAYVAALVTYQTLVRVWPV